MLVSTLIIINSIFIITTKYHHPEQRLTNSEYNRGPALLSLKSNQAWFLPLLSVPSACTALQFKPQYALSCPPKINATVRESVHCSGPDVDACAHDMEAFAGLITATGREGASEAYIPINYAASTMMRVIARP